MMRGTCQSTWNRKCFSSGLSLTASTQTLLSDMHEQWTRGASGSCTRPVVFICVSAALSETAAAFPAACGHREHLHQHPSESLHHHHHHHQLMSLSGSSDQLNNSRPLSQDLANTHRSLLHELQESILHLRAENLYQIFINYKERYDMHRSENWGVLGDQTRTALKRNTTEASGQMREAWMSSKHWICKWIINSTDSFNRTYSIRNETSGFPN